MGKESNSGLKITGQMVEAGLAALAQTCELPIAFPAGGEHNAVKAVLNAALEILDRSDEPRMPPITAAVLQAGVTYLFASGLIHWNEPELVVRAHVQALLAELVAVSG